jgi:3-oxoacyl-(acyl-carrier-protein) synthase
VNPVVTAVAARSAAGDGLEALAAAIARGLPLSRVVPYATEGLRTPVAALLPEPISAEDLLGHLVSQVLPRPPARPARVGLVVATASGAITGPFERWHRDGGTELPWRQWPTLRVAERFALAPATTLSVACASGTAAFHVARGWLRDGVCDAVIVAGVDVLSLYVHAGFAGLGALCKRRPAVFAAERDGLLLGEGGAAFLLEPLGGPRPALVALRGAGLAQDGVHYTAPDRTGDGLWRAADLAVAESGIEIEGLGSVSLHGTGTRFNDAMEARALSRLFGGIPVPVHAPKLAIGHAMGAAGCLEAAALLAFVLGAPAPPPLDPGDCEIATGRAFPGAGLSVSAAFGGVDAALVLGSPAESSWRPRVARRTARVAVEAEAFELRALGAPPALGRSDTYVRAGIAALRQIGPLPPGTAVVLSSQGNCRQADHRYHRDLLERGPAAVSRVHFQYTIPGAPLAEAAILLGLKGPALAFCDGPARAEAEARRLVEHGHADTAVALSVEAPERAAIAAAVRYEAA